MRQVLNHRLANVSASSQQDATTHREAIAKRRDHFQAAWGPQGSEQTRLRQSIEKVAAIGKHEFRQAMQLTGPLARRFEARIEAIQTVEQGNQLGETLAGEVVAAAMDEWRRICEESKRKYAELLDPLMETSETALTDIAPEEVGRPAAGSSYKKTSVDFYDTLRGVFTHTHPMQFAVGIVLTTVTAPVGIPLAAGGGLWGAVRGLQHTRKQQLQTTRTELTRHLRAVFQRVEQHFWSVDLSRIRFSRIDEYFNELGATVDRQVEAIVTQRAKETRLELARLKAQAQLKGEARERAAAGVHEAIGEWEGFTRELAALMRDHRVRAQLAASSTESLERSAAQSQATGLPSS
jgi:hypothetical protein